MTRPLRGTEIIAAEIVRHGLVACAAEMSTTLVRAAHEPINGATLGQQDLPRPAEVRGAGFAPKPHNQAKNFR